MNDHDTPLHELDCALAVSYAWGSRWKKVAKALRREVGTARRYWKFWEGMAKGRIDKQALHELERVRLDAFAGWFSARLLHLALEQALREGTFSLATRVDLEKSLSRVHLEDPDQYREEM